MEIAPTLLRTQKTVCRGPEEKVKRKIRCTTLGDRCNGKVSVRTESRSGVSGPRVDMIAYAVRKAYARICHRIPIRDSKMDMPEYSEVSTLDRPKALDSG